MKTIIFYFVVFLGFFKPVIANSGAVRNKDNNWTAKQTFPHGTVIRKVFTVQDAQKNNLVNLDLTQGSLEVNKIGAITDAVGVSVANTAGTTFVFFDISNSRVGISTSAPTEKLQMNNGNARFVTDSGTDVNLILDNVSATDSKSINFNGGGSLHGLIGVGGTAGDLVSDSTGQDLTIKANGGGRAINFTVDGTTTQMKILGSTGGLLLQTSTAFNAGSYPAILQIKGDTDEKTTMQIFRTSGNTSPPTLVFGKSRSWGNTILQTSDLTGQIIFAGADGSDYNSYGARIYSMVGTGISTVDDFPGILVFETTADGAATPTERMRIQSDGTVSINKTADTTPALDVNGHIHATQYVTTSDKDLKKNVLDLTCNLAEFKSLKPKSYKWKTEPSEFTKAQKDKLKAVYGEEMMVKTRKVLDEDGKEVDEEYKEPTGSPDYDIVAKQKSGVKVGFLAQDFEGTTYENCVVNLDGGAKGLDYACITASLWSVNQALLTRIEALEAK